MAARPLAVLALCEDFGPNCLPVGDVGFLPLWRIWKDTEATNVGDATSGLEHHIHRVGVQLPCHLQPEELLHFLDFFDNRTTVLSFKHLFLIFI